MTAQDLTDIQTLLDSWLPESYLEFMQSGRPRLKNVFYYRDQIIEANLAVRKKCWRGEPLDRSFYVFGSDDQERVLLLDLDFPGGLVMRQDESSPDPSHRCKMLSKTFEGWVKSAGQNDAAGSHLDDSDLAPPKRGYPFLAIGFGVLIGMTFCRFGFVRFAEHSSPMTTALPGTWPFAAGLYVLLLTVVMSAMHPRPPAPRLRAPKLVLLIGLPGCLCIAAAAEYLHTCQPWPGHAVLGFWDSIGTDGAVIWGLLALHSAWVIALSFFAWSLPVIQHRRKSHLSSPV